MIYALKFITDRLTTAKLIIVSENGVDQTTDILNMESEIEKIISEKNGYIILSDSQTIDFLQNNIIFCAWEHMQIINNIQIIHARYFSMHCLSVIQLYNAFKSLLLEWEKHVEETPRAKKALPKNYKSMMIKMSGIKNMGCASSYFNSTNVNNYYNFTATNRGGIINRGNYIANELTAAISIDIKSAYHAFEDFAKYPVLSHMIRTNDIKAVDEYIKKTINLISHGFLRLIFSYATGYILSIDIKKITCKNEINYFKIRQCLVTDIAPLAFHINALELASLLIDYDIEYSINDVWQYPQDYCPKVVKILRDYCIQKKEEHKGKFDESVYKNALNTLSGKDQYNRLNHNQDLPGHCDNYISIGNYDTLYTRLYMQALIRKFCKEGIKISDIATDGFTAYGISISEAEEITKRFDKMFIRGEGKLKIKNIYVCHMSNTARIEWKPGKGRFYKLGASCGMQNDIFTAELTSIKTLEEISKWIEDHRAASYTLTTNKAVTEPFLYKIGDDLYYTKIQITNTKTRI